MDRLVERFLTKIEVKDMKPFENSFFTKMENLNSDGILLMASK